MASDYVERVYEEMSDVSRTLFNDFPEHKDYLKYRWSEHYGDYELYTRLRIKKSRTLTSPGKWFVIVKLLCYTDLTKVLADPIKEKMIIEAIAEAKAFIELREAEIYKKLIDFNVKLKGVVDTVRDLLAEEM